MTRLNAYIASCTARPQQPAGGGHDQHHRGVMPDGVKRKSSERARLPSRRGCREGGIASRAIKRPECPRETGSPSRSGTAPPRRFVRAARTNALRGSASVDGGAIPPREPAQSDPPKRSRWPSPSRSARDRQAARHDQARTIRPRVPRAALRTCRAAAVSTAAAMRSRSRRTLCAEQQVAAARHEPVRAHLGKPTAGGPALSRLRSAQQAARLAPAARRTERAAGLARSPHLVRMRNTAPSLFDLRSVGCLRRPV